MKSQSISKNLWVGVFVLVGLSLGFYGAYQVDRRFVADVAERVDGGRKLSEAQRLELYVRYAFRTIRNPGYSELSPWPVRYYYALNPLHPGPGDVLRWGSDYRGGCGSHTRVVLAMLQSRGVRSRPLFILDDQGHSIHTVIETRVGDRWVVADPLCGIVYHRRDGALATRQDLAADTAFFRAQVDTIPRYDPRYDYDSVALLNWQKIPVVLPALRLLLTRILGRDQVESIARPGIWMWPRAFMSVSCLMAALVLALSAWRLSRRDPLASAAVGGATSSLPQLGR